MKYLLSIILTTLLLTLSASAQKPKPKPTPPKPAAPKTAPKTTAACAANGLTAAEIASIVDEHNKTRAALGLPKLTWNCTLANTAQDWAKRGVFEHRADTSYGENLFVSSTPTAQIAMAMHNWEKEKSFWDNKAGTCQPGKVCTHYTQMVWRGTSEIGCGINRSAPGQWKALMVCNYNPGGQSGSAY